MRPASAAVMKVMVRSPVSIFHFRSWMETRTIVPVLRMGSPGSPFCPTFHSRPICSATSSRLRPCSEGRVTTTISPPLFARTSSITACMLSRWAASITLAKSLTYPTGAGSCSCALDGAAASAQASAAPPAAAQRRGNRIRCRARGASVRSEVPFSPSSRPWPMKRSVWVLAVLVAAPACGGGENVVLRASLDDAGAQPVADLPVRLLPYDRQAILDSLARANESPEPTLPRDAMDRLRSLQAEEARGKPRGDSAAARGGAGGQGGPAHPARRRRAR